MGAPTPPPSKGPSLREPALAIPLALLFGVLVFDLARFGRAATETLRTPVSRDYGEGCVLAMVQLLAERGTYFTSLRDYPFVHGNYPPVFPLLNLPGYLWLGPTLLMPRLLSVLATLALVVVLALLVRRETGSAVLGGSFGLLLLGPWFVQTWAALGRVDMVACLFSLLGLYLFHRAGPEGRGRWLGYACLWLAFFTKQNALLAPAALVLGMALDSATRSRAPRVLAEVAVPLLALFGALCLLTHGEAFNHLIPYTAAADYEWDRMGRAYRDFFTLIGPLVALILPAAVAFGAASVRGPLATYLVYWLLNLAALVTISKAGAAQNYFIEPYVATLVLAALFTGRAARAGEVQARAWPAYVLVVALVVSLADMERGRSRLPPQEPQELAELYAIVAATPGPILSEDLSALVLGRKPVLVEPFGALLISRRGLLNPDRIVADCRQGRFALVVSDFRLRDLAGMDACLGEHYEPWKRLGPYELLRPRGAVAQSPRAFLGSADPATTGLASVAHDAPQGPFRNSETLPYVLQDEMGIVRQQPGAPSREEQAEGQGSHGRHGASRQGAASSPYQQEGEALSADGPHRRQPAQHPVLTPRAVGPRRVVDVAVALASGPGRPTPTAVQDPAEGQQGEPRDGYYGEKQTERGPPPHARTISPPRRPGTPG